MKEQFDLLLGNCWVLHKVLKWYLPIHFVEFSSQGPYRYELRPAIPVQPLEQQWRNSLIYYSETVELYTRFWNDISQLILWNSFHKGHRYELRPPFLHNLWTNQTWFISQMLGGRKLLLKLKHVKPYLFLKTLCLNIATNWLPWQSHQNLKCWWNHRQGREW